MDSYQYKISFADTVQGNRFRKINVIDRPPAFAHFYIFGHPIN